MVKVGVVGYGVIGQRLADGVAQVAITIIRRVADPGDTHRGLTNVLQIDPVPNHQAVDLMTIKPTGWKPWV